MEPAPSKKPSMALEQFTKEEEALGIDKDPSDELHDIPINILS